jgi:hypothetical protein
MLVDGSWGATEQETDVSQQSPLQNSYFLRKKALYGGMGTGSFAKVPCKNPNLCNNFCKVWEQPIELYAVVPQPGFLFQYSPTPGYTGSPAGA